MLITDVSLDVASFLEACGDESEPSDAETLTSDASYQTISSDDEVTGDFDRRANTSHEILEDTAAGSRHVQQNDRANSGIYSNAVLIVYLFFFKYSEIPLIRLPLGPAKSV